MEAAVKAPLPVSAKTAPACAVSMSVSRIAAVMSILMTFVVVVLIVLFITGLYHRGMGRSTETAGKMGGGYSVSTEVLV